MLNRMAKPDLRSILLIGSTLAVLLTGTGVAAAQAGSGFQDQGVREDSGTPYFGEPARNDGRVYAYAPRYHRLRHR